MSRMLFSGLLFKFLAAVSLLWTVNLWAKDSEFIQYQHKQLAIKNVTLIDGTGEKTRYNQTVILESGKVKAIGKTEELKVFEGIKIIDGKGKTLIPGLVMMHEHMFYPTGKANYTEMLYSFPRLYLAGGATTIRTAGTTAPYADLNLKDAIAKGKSIGPDIDVTAPYLNGPGLPILKVKPLRNAENARAMMEYWSSEGVTSYKAYMHIRQDELAEVIKQAHKRKQKVTAHLCSITYREAAELGIDNLEHGFFASTDFVKNKKKNECPRKGVHQSLVDLDINSKEVNELIEFLVQKGVTITSTLPVFETYTKGRPKAYPEALQALIPQVRDQYESRWEKIAKQENATWPIVFKKMMALEKKFVEAGGKLMAGTDPTGYGGVIAGFSNQRVVELLVEAGFDVEQAIKISSLNAANYLERGKLIGSIEVGKRADLVLIDGDLKAEPAAIRNMEIVFKEGVGYSSKKLIEATKSVVGLH
ncbi:MAG: amidohydrolase family protein [Kangiellaceae bacterium]|nr:amidohydrolase family protein [Kangiellaceae bacterium]MCW8999810.1 amidohydrolase family protein [Kangiellaceae bacterium]